jgi:mannose-6-phosphate isomerase-like protein (cupin superfamily)
MVPGRLRGVELVDFSATDAASIERFESRAARVNQLARIAGAGAVAVIRLGDGGVVGRHPAVRTQLFVVVDGAGVVSGDDGVEVAIAPGQAVLWRAGEMHESRSETGMTAVVIETDDVRPTP